MTNQTYFLETFGCQMNILDSQLVEGQLRARGMRPVTTFHDADVILFNTCSVRQHAEDKVHARLGELRKLKKDRPEAIVGVIGCMAEREKEGVFVKAPHVDILCGPGELNQLPGLLDQVNERQERITALAGSLSRRTEVLQRALEYDSLEALDLSRAPGLEGNVLQSYIRVQRGCDKFCTYCVVPFTRGPERSRPASHIVEEARQLASRGCREITLLGQTVNSYVHQEDGVAVPFAKLLEKLNEVDEIDRIRFVTSFPADWDEDIFRVMRDYPRVMPYLHIPAQSGSDRVLKRMKRNYTASSYLKLMDTARKYLPDIALAGDIIVGFCGETDADFQETVELVRQVEYQSLYIFRYSPRPGTAADRVQDDDIPEEVKAARNSELLALQQSIQQKLREKQIGNTVEVLVEGFSKAARKARGETKGQVRTRGKSSPTFRVHENGGLHANVENGSPRLLPSNAGDATDARGTESPRAADFDLPAQASEQDRGTEVSTDKSDQLVGRTPHDAVVLFNAPASYIGAIVEVHIESATAHSLFGRLTGVQSPPRPPTQTTDSAPEKPAGQHALPIVS